MGEADILERQILPAATLSHKFVLQIILEAPDIAFIIQSLTLEVHNFMLAYFYITLRLLTIELTYNKS